MLRSLNRFVAAACLAVLVSACAQGAAKSPIGTVPPASGGAGCASVPDPGVLPDWQPPSTTPAIYPLIIANRGELTCGPNRVLFTLLDAKNNVLSKPDRTAKVAFFDLGRDPKQPIATADGTFIWAIQDVRGVYVVNVQFPEAGTYGAEFTTSDAGGPATMMRATFSVSPSTSVVRVGDKAPSTRTPTAADAGGNLARISTDSKPDPAFYEISVDAALAKHDPFVVVFATPKFCLSSQCGPTLDRIKPFAAKYPTVDFIHVEPYQLKFENSQLQAVLDANNALVSNEVTNAWGLTSEPWVFVVDRTGVVRSSLALIFSDAELTTALDAVK